MNLYKRVLCYCVLTVCAPVVLMAQRPPDPNVEIYIPRGMPIRIEASRDEEEPRITKYIVERRVAAEVQRLTMVELLVGPGAEVIRSRRYTTTRVSDPVTIAWASVARVGRLILIVERLETRNGAWVIDAKDQTINLRAVVAHGAKAVHRAKFVQR